MRALKQLSYVYAAVYMYIMRRRILRTFSGLFLSNKQLQMINISTMKTFFSFVLSCSPSLSLPIPFKMLSYVCFSLNFYSVCFAARTNIVCGAFYISKNGKKSGERNRLFSGNECLQNSHVNVFLLRLLPFSRLFVSRPSASSMWPTLIDKLYLNHLLIYNSNKLHKFAIDEACSLFISFPDAIFIK